MTTQELDAVKKEISEVSAFVKERVQPLREERDRLEKSITELTATEREIRRRALLSNGSEQKRRMESGPYAGSDVLDLAIAKSLYASARINGKSTFRPSLPLRPVAALPAVSARRVASFRQRRSADSSISRTCILRRGRLLERRVKSPNERFKSSPCRDSVNP